ncbi:unnamed protein product, partial [Nesidiocoris tenuis]
MFPPPPLSLMFPIYCLFSRRMIGSTFTSQKVDILKQQHSNNIMTVFGRQQPIGIRQRLMELRLDSSSHPNEERWTLMITECDSTTGQ